MARCGAVCGVGVKVLRRRGDGEVWGWWWYECEGVTKEGGCHI